VLRQTGWNEEPARADDFELNERTTRNSESEYEKRESRRKMVDRVAQMDGLVIDVGTGPGGSIFAPLLKRCGENLQLVANDLGEPVMRGLYRHFRRAGLAERLSCLVFDARQMPFRDESADAVTSVVGFVNIRRCVEALREAFRVLRKGGQLITVERSYEPGSPSADAARTRFENGFATLDEGIDALTNVGFALDGIEEDFRGKGKSDRGDGMPIGDDSWVHSVFYARK